MTLVIHRPAADGKTPIKQRIQAAAYDPDESAEFYPAWVFPDGSLRIVEAEPHPNSEDAQRRAQAILEAGFDPLCFDHHPKEETSTMSQTDDRIPMHKPADHPPMLAPSALLEGPFGQDRVHLIEDGITLAVRLCHTASFEAGWWIDPATGKPKGTVPEKLCLIHSEISEAMEGDRKGLRDDKLPHRWMIEVELADALIRIFDLAGALRSQGVPLDLGGAVVEKLAYNAQRADHKLENRAAANGKAY